MDEDQSMKQILLDIQSNVKSHQRNKKPQKKYPNPE